MVWPGADSDFARAVKAAEHAGGSPEQATAYVEWLRCRTRDLLLSKRVCLEVLAETLIGDKELDSEQVRTAWLQGTEITSTRIGQAPHPQ